MSRVAVYILVTGPPVRIERVHPRAGPPRSEITVGQDYAQRLSATKDYDLFVSEAGPVGQALGPFSPEHFRLQVSAAFDDGNSWELACFAAHALAKEARLAETDDEVDAALLLTGRIDLALAVGTVGHLKDKLEHARPVIEDWRGKNVPVTLVVPAADGLPDAGTLPAEVEIVRAAHVDDLMTRLNLPWSETAAAPPPIVDRAPAGRARTAVSLLVLAVFVVAGLALAMTEQGRAMLKRIGIGVPEAVKVVVVEPPPPEVKQQPKKPPAAEPKKVVAVPPPKARLRVFERRAPEGSTCAHVHFGGVVAVLAALAPGADGRLPDSDLDNLCGVAFEAEVATGLRAAVWLKRRAGDYLRGGNDMETPHTFTGNYRWTIDLPKRMPAPLDYSIVLVSGSEAALEMPRDLDRVREKGGVALTVEHYVRN